MVGVASPSREGDITGCTNEKRANRVANQSAESTRSRTPTLRGVTCHLPPARQRRFYSPLHLWLRRLHFIEFLGLAAARQVMGPQTLRLGAPLKTVL